MKTVEVLRKLARAFKSQAGLMDIAYRVEDRKLRFEGDALTGDTFKVKDRLRDHGGIWSSSRKAWVMPAGMRRTIELLLAPAGLEAAAGNEQDLAAIVAYLRGFWIKLERSGDSWANLLAELEAAIEEDRPTPDPAPTPAPATPKVEAAAEVPAAPAGSPSPESEPPIQQGQGAAPAGDAAESPTPAPAPAPMPTPMPMPKPKPKPVPMSVSTTPEIELPAGVTLFKHQLEAVERLLAHPKAFLLADAPRVGKTYALLTAAKAARNIKNDLSILIICPASLVWMWHSAVKQFGLQWTDLAMTRVVSYDVFRRYYGDYAYSYGRRKVLLILDEAHKVKNARALITSLVRNFIFIVQKSGGLWGVWAATGTPFQNNPDEFSTLLSVLDVNSAIDLSQFYYEKSLKVYHGKRARTIKKRYWKSDISGLRELLSKQSWFLRRELSDVVHDMPPIVRETVEIDGLGLSFSHAFEEIDKTLSEHIAKLIEAGKMEEAQRVDALLRGVVGEESDYAELFPVLSRARALVADAKARAAASYIEDLCEDTSEQFLVFAHHESVIETIYKKLERLKVPAAVITGSTPAGARQEIVDKFQKGELRVLVLSIRAAGEGLTLDRAARAVFVELDWNPAALVQAENRIMNITNKESKLVTYLIVNHRIERAMINVINRKARAALQAYANDVTQIEEVKKESESSEDSAETDAVEYVDFLDRVRDEVIIDCAEAPAPEEAWWGQGEPSGGYVRTEKAEVVAEEPPAREPLPELPLWGASPNLFSGTTEEKAIGGPEVVRIPARARWGILEKNKLKVRYFKAAHSYLVSYNENSVSYNEHEVESMKAEIRRVFDVAKLKRCDETTLKLLEALQIVSRERLAERTAKKNNLKERVERVGFSEIATVMGANRWESPAQLWARKIGQEPEKQETLGMTWGRETEKILFKLWWEQKFSRPAPRLTKGVSYQRPAVASEDLAGIVDFYVIDPTSGDRVVVETKVSNIAEVSEAYKLQINAQLGALGLRYGYVVVMVGAGREIITERVDFDEELYKKQLDAAREFMQCVHDKTPPVPAGVRVEDEVARTAKVEVDSDLAREIEQLLKVEETYSVLSEQREKLRERVKEYMTHLQLNELRFDDAVLRLRVVESERLDTRSLKKEHPDLAQKFIKQYSYATLKIEK